MKGGFEELNAKLEAATTGVAGLMRKRVFSRNTFFVDSKLFALVWREGRIAVKLPEPGLHAKLSALPGTTAWIAWGRPMVGWLLVPEPMHNDAKALATWVRDAAEAVRAAEAAPAHETVVGAVEPLPSPERVAAQAPAKVPSKAPAAPSVSPTSTSKAPSAAPPAKAPSATPPAAAKAPSAPPDGGEFSFGDESPEAAPAPAAPEPPPAAAAEADGDAFSFDSPEEGPKSEGESQEFDFGGEPEPAPASGAEPGTGKKKKKGKKKAG